MKNDRDKMDLEAVNRETQVVKEVVRYFSSPKFERFFKKKEYPIQMGSKNCRADVVLIDRYEVDRDKSLAAIIECKKMGHQGRGLDQLKSYLSAATNMPLGVFANSTDPADWKFYENLGQNRFREITRSKFEWRVLRKGRIKAFLRRMFPWRSASQNGFHTSSVSLPQPEPSPSSGNPPQPGVHIFHQEGSQTMQDENLNGHEPYYSEKNGFYWATNHRGVAECVPPHIKQIISNGEREEINQLRETRSGLEEQKRDCEREIKQKIQKLGEKNKSWQGSKSNYKHQRKPN